jgi:hypothetical protein
VPQLPVAAGHGGLPVLVFTAKLSQVTCHHLALLIPPRCRFETVQRFPCSSSRVEADSTPPGACLAFRSMAATRAIARPQPTPLLLLAVLLLLLTPLLGAHVAGTSVPSLSSTSIPSSTAAAAAAAPTQTPPVVITKAGVYHEVVESVDSLLAAPPPIFQLPTMTSTSAAATQPLNGGRRSLAQVVPEVLYMRTVSRVAEGSGGGTSSVTVAAVWSNAPAGVSAAPTACFALGQLGAACGPVHEALGLHVCRGARFTAAAAVLRSGGGWLQAAACWS